MSSSTQKSRLNRDAVGENQSIFDFLKRKKQFNLENTINKSYQSSSNTKRKVDIDVEDEFPQTRDLTKYRTYETNRMAQTSRQAITPQKIDFEDQKQTNRSANNEASPVPAANNRRGKSFLSMISPIKNRTNSALEQRQDQKEKENRSKSGIKGGKAQNFTRGKVTKCINSIKETVTYLNDNVRRIQDKSHGLTVQFNPIFNKFSDSTDPFSRQVGELRNKLKAFDSLVNGVTIENCDQIVQNFHRNMEDHIQSELHHLKKQLEKAKSEQISSIHEDRQAKIDKLQADIKKVTKDNELLVRRLQKAESLHEKVEESFSEKKQSHAEQLDKCKEAFESTIVQLKNRNSDLQQRLHIAQERAREAEKSYKNERMVKESMDDRYKQEIQQITEAKDAYLLNEIMVLKAEFNADMSRINDLHKVKEAQLLNRLNKREQEIDKKMFEKGCDKQIESKILEQASQLKQQNIQLKNKVNLSLSKSECIVTDMYRMNEELYQHWMALKDIKVLSTRLGSFAQFRKIYDDLLFNDHLFH